ncbi:MAG: cupin domain-containing protein [Alphaproteobacteria bacterium]|nr:cupin domain-containing protein [Alphaproteobacteria bacterium]
MHHPLNPNAEIFMTPLSDRAGMRRAHLWLARVPPGKESFIYHAHSVQEEFVYILSGHGTAEIGDQRLEVGPGDFMGFPTDGVGHHLLNTGSEDLVYLMGGERTALEVGTFPRLGKRVIFEAGATMAEGKVTVVDDDRASVMSVAEWIDAGRTEDEPG